MSLAGTAYDGTMRRGSQTSTALVLSSTVTSPSVARMRLAVGSYRSWPNPAASKLRTRVLIAPPSTSMPVIIMPYDGPCLQGVPRR